MIAAGLALAFGVTCRVLSLALMANGTVTMVWEFTTPHTVAPDGMLLCDASPRNDDFGTTALDMSTAEILVVDAGGTQFDTTSTVRLDLGEFLARTNGLDELESGVLDDFLAFDSHYASSFSRERLDDVSAAVPGLVHRRRSLVDESVDDNCVLITAHWLVATRYTLTLTIDDYAATTLPTGPFWIAPATYGFVEDGEVMTISIRGDKLGAQCLLTPPIVTTNCSGGFALSPRNGGECVRCPTEGNCSACPVGRLPIRAGTVACGPHIGAATISQLAMRLCELFTTQLLRLRNGTASDAVAESYAQQLVEIGSAFVDVHIVEQAELHVAKHWLRDARRPNLPTRLWGLQVPNNCNGNDGFIDPRTGATGVLKDRRFESIRALQVIGVALVQSGQLEHCAALFDETTVGDAVDPFSVRRFFWNWRDL